MGFAQPATAGPGAPSHQPRLDLLRGGGEPSPAIEHTAAVIDLGSNSWRLVVYAYTPGAAWCRVAELQEPVRIAEGLSGSGRLSSAAIERGLETLDMFDRFLRARGVPPEAVDAVATSAIRDAENGRELVVAARERTGLAVRVLAAAEEAELGYLAAVNSTTLSDGVVLDLGGGSLQLTRVAQRRLETTASWPLGAVRVTEALLPGTGPASRKQLKRARRAIRDALGSADWLAGHGGRLVGMGGAVRSLAAAGQRLHDPEPFGIQGYALGRRLLGELVRELAKRPVAARALPGIKTARADVILGGALVLEAVLELGGFDAIEVTRSGLREGVFFSRRLLRDRVPLLPDVRAAAVRNLALQFDADLEHAEHVARLALQLHGSLVEQGVLSPTAGEPELLRAAALLHDIGVAIGYDGHPGHGHYMIVNAGLDGYGPRETDLIAQIVRGRGKGAPEDGSDPVARCALLLRLADLLDAGQDQAVREARFALEDDSMRLELRGDDQLARWAVARRLPDGAFRRAFGRRLTTAA